MAILPQRLLRLTGFSTTYLTGTAGNNGEVYYDLQTKSLRIMDGTQKGGYQLARTDLNNVTNAVVSAKVTASGVLTWSNVSGKPAFSTVATSGSYTDLTNKPTQVSTFTNDAGYLTTVAWSAVSGKPTFSAVATSGSYTDLTNTPAPVSLTGYATESFVNTQISNLVDGAPGVLNTLNELAAAINDDSTFAGTVFAALDAKASLDSPQFTGTVSVNNLEISGLVSPSYETVTPTGSVEATAAAITKNTVVIPTGSNTGGVRLPAGALGTRILIRNNSSSTHYVYAPQGQVIAGGFGGPDTITMAVLKEYLYLETGVWTVVTH